jgi:uncharacterized membrane protein
MRHLAVRKSNDFWKPNPVGSFSFPLIMVGCERTNAGGGAVGGVMSKKPATQNKDQIVGDRGLAFAVYILYFLGYLTGITALIGIILAYLQSGSGSPELRTHYTFQVRTFWIGVLYVFVGVMLLHIGIGVIVLLWGLVWSIIRNVKGILALNRNEPIAKPESWLFGD